MVDDNKSMAKDTFGKNLEKLLSDFDITITALSKKTGISKSTLQGYVGAAGNFPSNPIVFKALSEVFGLSIHELIFGEPDPYSEINTNQNTIYLKGKYKIYLEKIKEGEK